MQTAHLDSGRALQDGMKGGGGGGGGVDPALLRQVRSARLPQELFDEIAGKWCAEGA